MSAIEPPWIIDVEASGFGPDSYPIEIGLALASGRRYCSLIRPPSDWVHWTTEAESYHHLCRDTLFDHGQPVEMVVGHLNRLLGERTVYSDGWVVDKPWVIKLFHRAGVRMSFRLSPLEMILSEAQMEIWHQVKEDIVAELKIDRHRASNDALIIQQTYLTTKQLTNGG